MASKTDPLIDLVQDIGGFTHDPLGHARYAYPWGHGSLTGLEGPRKWQAGLLGTIGRHLSNPDTRYAPCRIAIASGHGIGKSAAIGMVTKWGLDTCEDTRIVMTANTESQILTKTVPEVTKWHNLSITSDWFKATATAFISTVAGHDKAWRADAVTWSQHNTEAFAGLHNQGKRIIIIMDEASNIADKVWEVTEGALTDEQTEIIWLAFGNPTRATGRFRECFGKYRHLWYRQQIDSRTVEGTNKAYLDEMVRTYGENSDIAKVRVRGMFPSASSLQFIGTDLVQAARTRQVQTLASDPLIFGVDVARFGDDHSTLAIRQGRDARKYPWKRWHGADTMQVAGDIAVQAELLRPDAVFVDAGAMGAGVIDRLRQLNVPNVFEVNFGGAGREVSWSGDFRIKTANKRAEIWASGRLWLQGGAKAWRSAWWDEGDDRKDALLRNSGYNEQCFWAPRWETTGADVYGSSPGFDALPDLRELQMQMKRKREATDHHVKPELMVAANVKLKRLPGAVTSVAALDMKNAVAAAYQVPYQTIEVIRKDIVEVQRAVDMATYADLFLAITNMQGVQPRNVEEIASRNEEKLTQLGPVIERVENEKLQVAIDRAYGILLRANMLPSAPQALEGVEIKIEFVSILAQMQRMIGLGQLERSLSFTGNLAAAQPDVLDNVDFDEVVREYFDRAGTPPKALRPADDVEKIRASRAQQQRMQQAIASLPAVKDGADAAQLLSETDVGGGRSLLQSIAGQP